MGSVPVILLADGRRIGEGDHSSPFSARGILLRGTVAQMALASGCRRATGKHITTVVPRSPLLFYLLWADSFPFRSI